MLLKRFVLVLCSVLAPAGASLMAQDCWCDKFYLKAGVGGSFSQNADICVDNRQWNRADEGYSARVGNSELYNVAAGFRFDDLVSAECEVTVRPSFSYCKFQTPSDASTFSFAGVATRTRFFDLFNTSIMANVYFHGSGIAECLAWNFCDCWTLQPVFGAGVGVAYNNVNDFHTVFDNAANIINLNGLITRRVTSVELPHTNRAVCGQVTVGLELEHECIAAYVGYRYFNGGIFKSNNYLTSRNAATDATHAGTAVPWRGKLKSHEFVANLMVFIEI